MALHKTPREIAAEPLIKQAFDLFIEARKEITLYGFEQYIREHISELGSSGFVESIGHAIVGAAQAAENDRQAKASKG
jgi:hypothetical protein